MCRGKLLPAPIHPCLLRQHLPSLRASSASSHSLLPSFSCWKLTPIPCFLASPIPCYFPDTPGPPPLFLHMSAPPSGPTVAFPLLSLAHWAVGRKPFPPLSTLFPLVTPSTHGDYFSWQQVSSCQRERSVLARRRQEGRWGNETQMEKAPHLGTLRNAEGVHRYH